MLSNAHIGRARTSRTAALAVKVFAVLAYLALPVLLQLGTTMPPAYTPDASEQVQAILLELDQIETEDLLEQLESLAQQGDDSSAELLGEIHSFGLFGITRNRALACDYFERVSDRRPDGLHNRATCHFDGEGREQDFEKARNLYRLAAQGGWHQAWCAYGNMLIHGQGGPTDIPEGLRLCRMAAAAGDRDAQTDLGGYFLMGVGMERDPVAARFMLEQAASQEQANAAFLLGQIHEKGDGTPVDNAAAGEWFEKAYEWGRGDAAFRAGSALARRGFRMEGEEMFINEPLMREAIEWFALAERFDPDADTRAKASEMIASGSRLIAAAGKAPHE